jgi:hypothetical protein
VFVNDGTGRFSDATADLLPVDQRLGVAGALADFDLDGELDRYVLHADTDWSDPEASQDELQMNREEREERALHTARRITAAARAPLRRVPPRAG